MHPVKRRKIDPLQSSLSKPFRSPLRTRNSDADADAASVMPHRAKANARDQPGALSDSPQKQYAALARQLTLLRQSLDTAQQALRIQSSNQAADLDKLIAKWRSVVRDMAEELFEDAKQRMDGYGGVAQTWSHRQERTAGRPDLWVDDQEDQLTDAQRRILEMQRADDQAEADKYGLIEKTPDAEDADMSFTLDKMLLQMNCDLDLVGYDKEEQRWLD
ncbi:hypothetical protein DV738_g1997, partial [Chaetothyriales sp. CBS 135597]